MRGIKVFLPFLFVVFSSAVNAQKVWTLQECVDHALKNNIQVKQAELNTDLADVTKDQSLFNMFPSLNSGASHSYYFGRSVDPTTYQFTTNEIRSSNFSLTSSLAIFEGFQLQNSLKQSKLNYLSAKFDLEKIRNDISLNVVTFYLQVLYNRDLLNQAKEQVEASKVQRDRLKEMENVGAASRGSFLDMEAQFATDELRLVNAQSQYDAAVLSLAQLLELTTVTGFSVDTLSFPAPLVDYSSLNVSFIYETALKTQPDIRSSEYKVESASKGLSIARGASYPRLTLSGSISSAYSSSRERVTSLAYDTTLFGFTQSLEPVYTLDYIPAYEKTPFSDQLDENLSKSVGLNLVIPLFNGLQTRSGIRRAKIYLRQAQLNDESTRKSLFKSVQQAVNDVASANNRFSAARKSADALSESFDFNKQKFDLGMLNSFDFLVSKNNFTKSQSDLLQAKYDLIFKLKILDFYMGKPLTF
ncbi:MAG TPA: TolC family protein [Bacteroidia bacterium]|nr:TolC family protein [Bacteroidia bacterium]